jgi:hypothetical protein
MRTRSRVAAVALAAAFWPIALWSDDRESRFVPARLGSGPESMLGRIECPEPPAPERAVVVICQAWVEASGQTLDTKSYCFGDGGRRSLYSHAASDALDSAIFAPASVDGAPVPVYASFRVVFRGRGSSCSIAAIASLGGEMPGDDLDYIAPQEILSEGSWFSRTRELQFAGTRGGTARARGAIFSMSVAVSEQGVASDGRIEGNWGAALAEQRRAVRALERARFIPAFRDGVPIAMRYFEFPFVGFPP